MKVRRIVQRRIRRDTDGIQVAADVRAVLAINVNEGEDVEARQRETRRQQESQGNDAPEAGRERGT